MLNKLKEFENQYRTLKTELGVVLRNPNISDEYKIDLLGSTSIVISSRCMPTCVGAFRGCDLTTNFLIERFETETIISLITNIKSGDYDCFFCEENIDKNKTIHELLMTGLTEFAYDW